MTQEKEMTREELAHLLEQFAIVAIQAAITPMEVDDQHAIICSSIDTFVETVMFCNDRDRLSTPSIN
jgi:hypothetical protein